MDIRSRMRGRRRRGVRRHVDVDMDAIRDLAREAAACEEVRGVRAVDGERPGVVDVEPSVPDADAPDRRTALTDEVDGEQLNPWMSPRAQDLATPDANGTRPPFTPTHEYVREIHVPGPDGGSWQTERDDFMVVDGAAYTRDSWERGAGPDLLIAPDGCWWHEAGGCLFDPDDAPTPLGREGFQDSGDRSMSLAGWRTSHGLEEPHAELENDWSMEPD